MCLTMFHLQKVWSGHTWHFHLVTMHSSVKLYIAFWYVVRVFTQELVVRGSFLSALNSRFSGPNNQLDQGLAAQVCSQRGKTIDQRNFLKRHQRLRDAFAVGHGSCVEAAAPLSFWRHSSQSDITEHVITRISIPLLATA